MNSKLNIVGITYVHVDKWFKMYLHFRETRKNGWPSITLQPGRTVGFRKIWTRCWSSGILSSKTSHRKKDRSLSTAGDLLWKHHPKKKNQKRNKKNIHIWLIKEKKIIKWYNCIFVLVPELVAPGHLLL